MTLAAPKAPSRRLSLSLNSDHSCAPLSYLEMGRADGPVLVFLHGLGADCLAWHYCLPAFMARYRIIALDLPGHGRSGADVGDGDVAFVTGWLDEALTLLKVSSAHVVGHSMGAKLALGLAHRHPERVQSLSLIAPAGLGGPFHYETMDAYLAAPSLKTAQTLARFLVADSHAQMVPALAQALFEAVSNPERQAAFAKLLETAKTFGVALSPEWRDWTRLRCPIQFIWGDQDRLTPLREAAYLPVDAAIHVLPDVGHLPHVEAGAMVVARLKAFLETAV
ncbi:alpha/beta fold hydrolase [Asticcacaulis sp. ZE23SCel15]|uniref:alpha/beta fold hydrolase n=1 Tax=Asticcacaulis sp. ZE23SCel15 TaxID=3059027 RepID=UPI00265F7375|nr:alpha/beta fold hydrolase [Asticcacaulis sp. ZE23SCel15]WKL58126.1 alpha/beta fold hydrolase [Asticcacaulis sp. ZE23SCel15]